MILKAEENYTDEELAEKTAAGSHEFFDQLIRRYSPRLFHFIRPKLKNDEDCQDILQEVFSKAFQNIDRYDPAWKFSTWIYTITSRTVISFYRSSTSGQTDQIPEDAINTMILNPEQEHFHQTDQANLWVYARSLKKNQYQALWLKYAENLEITEIAGAMNLSQIYVRVLLHRARQNLARKMSGILDNAKLKQEDRNVLSTV